VHKPLYRWARVGRPSRGSHVNLFLLPFVEERVYVRRTLPPPKSQTFFLAPCFFFACAAAWCLLSSVGAKPLSFFWRSNYDLSFAMPHARPLHCSQAAFRPLDKDEFLSRRANRGRDSSCSNFPGRFLPQRDACRTLPFFFFSSFFDGKGMILPPFGISLLSSPLFFPMLALFLRTISHGTIHCLFRGGMESLFFYNDGDVLPRPCSFLARIPTSSSLFFS